MKFLLDTHAFMWWDSNPTRIPQKTLSLLTNADNEVYVSLVTLWEMQIKNQLGKLTLRTDLTTMLATQQTQNHLFLLSLRFYHIL